MMKLSMNIITVVKLMLGASLLASCEEIIDVEFTSEQTDKIVVEGMITTDIRAHRVKLTYTSDYFSPSAPQMVTGADVSISGGDSIFTLREVAPGDYRTRTYVKGETGRTYTLHVKLPDGREYEASSYLEPCAPIDSIRQSANYNSFVVGYGYDVLYYGPEPEPAGDYYFYRLYVGERLYTDTITEVSFINDDFVNGNYIHDFAIYRIKERDLFTPLDVTLEMYSASAEYHEFLTALMLETVWRGSPWDGPPANVPGNISNNGLGFFLAADIKRTSNWFYPTPRVN